MNIDQHIAALRREGELLATAAERVRLDNAVPTCPDWRVRDLLRHIGSVHRWAAEAVTRPAKSEFDAIQDRGGPWPDDGDLLPWFRTGHANLVAVLEAAPADLDCWYFLPAPSPLAFWARRQAHETAIHRADAESVSGAITPYPADFALDGIDELLFGFYSRPGRLRSPEPWSLFLYTADVGSQWHISVDETGPRIWSGPGGADCSVAGTASDIYLFLWNRRGADGLQVAGDRAVLDRWREGAKVRWG